MNARSTISGLPSSSRNDTNASPTSNSTITFSTSNFEFSLNVWAIAFTAFWSLGVKARKACCTLLPNWPNTVWGMSAGFWVMKYTPTPFERIKRTTCSIFSSKALGASLKSRCASSKKKAIFGLSRSPTSGKISKSSDKSHSKNVA